jgi:hypothetical protein
VCLTPWNEAEVLDKRALRVDEVARTPDQPKSAIHLPNPYQVQGQYSEAEPLFQRRFWIFHNSQHPRSSNRPSSVFYLPGAFLNASRQSHAGIEAWRMQSSIHTTIHLTKEVVP